MKAKFVILAMVFLSLRLYRIDQPLVEMHNVRQTQTAMIARNLLEDNFNLLYTRVDWWGNQPGYVVLEFPLYQAIVAVVWKAFGIHDIFGRLVTLVFSIVCAIYLYKIAEKLLSETVAYWSVFFFAICPLSIFMSRAMMINMTSLSLSLVGFYYWLKWSDSKKYGPLVIAAASLVLAALVNNSIVLPILLPMLYIAFTKRENSIRYYLTLVLFAVVFIAAMAVWSAHLAYVNGLYHPDWGLEKSLEHFFAPDIQRVEPYYYFRTAMYLLYFVLGFHGLILFIGGLKKTWQRKTKGSRILLAWLWGGLIYYLIFFNALTGHNYYWLPMVLPLSIFVGVFIEDFLIRSWVQKSPVLKGAVIAFVLTLLAWIALPMLHSTEEDRISYQAALSVKNISKPQDLILVGTLHTDVAHPYYPTILYYAERRGWNIAGGRWHLSIDTATVDSLRFLGAKFLVVTFGRSEQRRISSIFPMFKYFAHEVNVDMAPIEGLLRNRYSVVAEDRNYALYRL